MLHYWVLGPFKGGVNNARYALRKELSAHCMQFIWDWNS
jgi:hypothetical protein